MREGRLATVANIKMLPEGRKHKKDTSGKEKKKKSSSFKPGNDGEMGLVSSLWQGAGEPGAVRTTALFIHMGLRQERIKTQFENLRVTLGLCGLGTVGST